MGVLHIAWIVCNYVFDDIEYFQCVLQSFSHTQKLGSIISSFEICVWSPDSKEGAAKMALSHFGDIDMTPREGVARSGTISRGLRPVRLS